MFAGSLGEGRNIRAILDAFAAPAVNAHVVFLSGGGKLDSLVSEYCARHPNIHRLPAVPPAEVVRFVGGCDVGLCLIQPSCLSYKLSLPNKAFEYAQAGLPFLFTDLPEIDRLLGPAFACWHVDDPAQNLAEAITGADGRRLSQRRRANMARLRIPSWDEEAAGDDRRLLRSSQARIERSREGPGRLGRSKPLPGRPSRIPLPIRGTCLPPTRRRS